VEKYEQARIGNRSIGLPKKWAGSVCGLCRQPATRKYLYESDNGPHHFSICDKEMCADWAKTVVNRLNGFLRTGQRSATTSIACRESTLKIST